MSTSMKILVVFTGGTIGSTAHDGYISTDPAKPYKLLELYKNQYTRDVEFDTAEPYTLLSENLTGEYLKLLGCCLKENATKQYDGIIVTHGTDTLQYSAATMGYLLSGITMPVVFVSSGFVLEDPRANGVANFAAAVNFILSTAGTEKSSNAGVFVSYRNGDHVQYIHRGIRLLPHLPYSDDLFSIGGTYYGTVSGDGTFTKNAAYEEQEDDKIFSYQGLSLPDTWDSGISRIFPYPGMQYPDLGSISNGILAVLLDTYHSGTLCSITPDMEQFFKTAAERKISVFLTGADNRISYDSVRAWESFHINVLPPASPIAMYVKLWMALSSKELLKNVALDEIMNAPMGGDIL